MRFILVILLVASLAIQSPAQFRKKDGIKRKYQQVDQVNENLPPVRVHGRVLNADREKLAGATVILRGTSIGVNTNEDGEYFLTGLPTGKVSIQVSFVGYQTKIIDYYVQEGENDIYFTLDRELISLEPVTVTSQLREQQLPDIPAAISVLSARTMEERNIRDMSGVADYIPGLFIREQTPHRPNYVIRGLTSDEVSLSAQPRVSVYYNDIPVSRGSLASNALYDLERVEVLKGPQQTLFGRGAQIGVVQYVTKKPVSVTEGFLTAGAGEFGMKELQGALNLPLMKDKIFARAAGTYTYRDGYVENSAGGNLNGLNTIGGRFSLRILPFHNTKIDLMVNYQRDDLPGTAFMSKRFPNSAGINDIFQYEASLEQGDNLKNFRDLLGTSLEIKHFLNENNHFSFNASFYTNNADSRWDGDGTAAPAIDMAETMKVNQFTQELRYNFSRNSRTNGSIGISYWRENAEQSYWFGPNEQYASYLILQMPQYLVGPDGKSWPMPALPNDPQLGPLAGMPLPADHSEENFSSAINQSYDLFVDATRRLSRRLSLTAGVRGTLEAFKASNDSVTTAGNPSALGMLTGMYPNLFFKMTDPEEVSKMWLSLTYRANLQYELGPNSSLFAGYARGRRPNVIQFNSAGESEIMDAEKLHNFEAGIKTDIASRIWFDLTGFYHLFRDFQTNAWVNNNYLVKDAGKATSFGAEASVRVALAKNLDFFGNYAYIHARFDSIDSDGNAQLYAGNEFRLTPEHSYTAGFNARISLTRFSQFFFTPAWTWNSHIWFEDANLEGLEQDAYGTLNATAGFIIKNPDLVVSVYGTNLLEEKYVISAGNTGTMFGVPTFIPAAPRMLGARLTWKF